MSMQEDIQVPEETCRYLRDAADATEDAKIAGSASRLKFEDDSEKFIHNLNNLINEATDRDVKEMLWVAGNTVV